ncbi:Clavaminate synthase-like protein [Cyathus striatus]|nr:Clavaminate synthase-like protein [Cyathus striatus]
MAVQLVPLPLSDSVDRSKFDIQRFGKEVTGIDPGNLTKEEFKIIKEQLYKHDVLFRNVNLTAEQQHALVKAFDPTSEQYSHGNKKIDEAKKSVLTSLLRAIPRVPQVQLTGNGTVKDHEGIPELTMKHGHHKTFHKTSVSPEDEAKGVTRFFRWHIDGALYEFNVPKVTALYSIKVPKGPTQTVRYDDGTGDELHVPLSTTAFASGKIMFDILPTELKSVAVRAKATYAPRPFEWIRTARGIPTGLGLETEGLEVPLNELTPWREENVKTYPFVWKNPVTGVLHLQVIATAVREIHVDPLPEGVKRERALYPEGAHIKDLKDIRELLYRMQRPGITPSLVYPHPWAEKDLVLWNNRSLMHSVVGVLRDDHLRVVHQCNLAGSDEPLGPSEEDVLKWASGEELDPPP